MFGYEMNEIIGNNIDDLVAPADRDQEARSITMTGISGKRFALETVRRRKDSSLLHVSLIGAPIIAEKMRLRVRELQVPHGGSQVCEFVSISLGVATHIPERFDDPLNLLMKADAALYQAKVKGRDRIEVSA